MEEIYTTIPYHKEKWSAKVTTSIAKLKIISDQIPEVFFTFLKVQAILRYHRKEGADKVNVNNALISF